MPSTQNATPTTASTSSTPSTSSNVTPLRENRPTKRESPRKIEDRYPGNVYEGKCCAVHVWAFCQGCSTKKKAEAHASTQIKKKAENPEYEMVGKDDIVHVKTIPIEAEHFNPALSPCAEESCNWENCVSYKAAYAIPKIVELKNEQSNDFFNEGFFCTKYDKVCRHCDGVR